RGGAARGRGQGGGCGALTGTRVVGERRLRRYAAAASGQAAAPPRRAMCPRRFMSDIGLLLPPWSRQSVDRTLNLGGALSAHRRPGRAKNWRVGARQSRREPITVPG